MKPIDISNFGSALDIITEAFIDNPAMKWLIGKDRLSVQRIQKLCIYCLRLSQLNKGAYISNDSNGVAMVYSNHRKPPLMKLLALQAYLIHHCVGWHRVHLALKRESMLRSIRHKGKHLYFLMIATRKNANGVSTVAELRDEVFKLSKRAGLPIYAETSLEKNRILYERYGFVTYASCVLPGADFTIWFMMRDSSRY